METNYLTEILLPLALGVIMLGMGLSLSLDDFKRIVIYPKAVAIGIINQLVLLPVVGFVLLLLFPMRTPELAVGIMILAACPGGATSNLISHISKGDTALSITLTAISSLAAVITIPLIVNFGLYWFMEQGSFTPLPVFDTILKVIIITILPVSIGMLIRKKALSFAGKMDKPVKILSAVLLFLIIAAAIVKERANFIDFFQQAGPVSFLLNVSTLALGFITAKLFSLNRPQQITVSIESGIQNGTLGIAIAATLLKDPIMTIPPAIYSLIMFGTAGLIIAWAHSKMNKPA
jgi:bile acid:Na+ symporter, BASS family